MVMYDELIETMIKLNYNSYTSDCVVTESIHILSPWKVIRNSLGEGVKLLEETFSRKV